MRQLNNGIFVVSLDFELHWGVHDKKTTTDYEENLLGVRTVIPALLKLFKRYNIHATWATTGFLFFDTKSELIEGLPDKTPNYKNSNLSPYRLIPDSIGKNENDDPFHYAPKLVEKIVNSPNQEIGTHTFSHYYCLEEGQNAREFKADLRSAIDIAKKFDVELKSLVFPRNQFNNDYKQIIRDMGINAYRGNYPSWLYQGRSEEEEKLIRRIIRLSDHYVKLSGSNAYTLQNTQKSSPPVDINASRFLRPYWDKMDVMERVRLRRITTDLKYAAKHGLIYHLWWHPHNFGADLNTNIRFLKKILDRYSELKSHFGMKSLNLNELSSKILNAGQK